MWVLVREGAEWGGGEKCTGCGSHWDSSRKGGNWRNLGGNLPRSESGVTGVTGKEGPDRRAFPRQN